MQCGGCNVGAAVPQPDIKDSKARLPLGARSPEMGLGGGFQSQALSEWLNFQRCVLNLV